MSDNWQKYLTEEERRDLKRYRYTVEPVYRDLAEARMERDTAKGLPTDAETCDSCGSAVAIVWHARDEEWEAVVGGPGGIRCVRCFAAEAGQKGIHLAFVTVPFEGNWTTDLPAALEALEEAQGKLDEVEKEAKTVADYGRKTCKHAVCGLARRILGILHPKEGTDG